MTDPTELNRSDETQAGRQERWFAGDGALLRLVLEAQRIRLAQISDPWPAAAGVAAGQVAAARQMGERMGVQRLQPHFTGAFFQAAFAHLGGTLRPRGPDCFEIRYVPAVFRARSQGKKGDARVLRSYQQVCFQQVGGDAALLGPGHPLFDAVVDVVWARYRGLLARGAVLVDAEDFGQQPRLLIYLQQGISDADRLISQRLQFVEAPLGAGEAIPRGAGPAPYHDYRPPAAVEMGPVQALATSLPGGEEALAAALAQAQGFAAGQLAPQHLAEVQAMTRSPQAQDFTLLPPQVIGAALIAPQGLLQRLAGRGEAELTQLAQAAQRARQAAMAAVLATEQRLGREPHDVSAERRGYDIESLIPDGEGGRLHFLAVKVCLPGARSVAVTKQEIAASANSPAGWVLALATAAAATADAVRYLRAPFHRQPAFHVAHIHHDFELLWQQAAPPEVCA